MKEERKDNIKTILIIFFIIVFIVLAIVIEHTLLSNSINSIYETGFEEKTYNGIIYDVQLTSFTITVVFNNGFYLTFSQPSNKLIDCYPYLETIFSAYADLILLKNNNVEIRYIHSFDGFNYFGDSKIM